MAGQKIPPPPEFTGPQWQSFNRWLLELTGILAAGGGIDPNSIDGFDALEAQVAANTLAITALQGTVTALQAQVSTNTADIAANTASISALAGSITTLAARGELLFGTGAPAAGLGKVNDWYGDTAGAAGARVWIKKVPGVWTPFPF